MNKEDKTHLLNYAMYAGIFLGGFWVLKYFLIIAGFDNPMLRGLNSILSVVTPVLLFYYLKNYNEKFLHHTMRFWHGVQFSIILFLFASILEALIVLIHVKWIDPMFISMMYETVVEMAKTFGFGSTITNQLAEQGNPSPFFYVFNNVIMSNVFIGFILSLIIVPIVQRFRIVRNEQ
jgi:hypothetical protein